MPILNRDMQIWPPLVTVLTVTVFPKAKLGVNQTHTHKSVV